MVARMPEFTRSGQRTFRDQVLKVTRRRRAGRLCDRDVFSALSPLEAVDALLEHADDRLFLAGAELPAEALIEFRLCDVEVDALVNVFLRFENGAPGRTAANW